MTESPEHRPGSSASFTGRRWISEMAVLVLCAFFLVFAIKLWIAEPLVVSASSMYPILAEGERIVMDKRAYAADLPAVGDVVVFVDPEGGARRLVKRVVASGGELLTDEGGLLGIDSRVTSIPIAFDLPGPNSERAAFPLLLGQSELFVVGDNAEVSRDSRAFGPVPLSAVSGRVSAVYWPPKAARAIEGTEWIDLP